MIAIMSSPIPEPVRQRTGTATHTPDAVMGTLARQLHAVLDAVSAR
jgi:hypothetical protein